ncbi:MAG: hypothetical protein ACREJ3_13065, partial [Polyangiaceae bacterium]
MRNDIMLALRAPLKTLATLVLASLCLAAPSAAAEPASAPGPVCAAVQQRAQEAQQALVLCEGDRDTIAANRAE